MQSISTNDSNSHVNIIVQLLENDASLSHYPLPVKNTQPQHQIRHPYVNYIIIFIAFIYSLFILYSFIILFTNHSFNNNIYYIPLYILFIISQNLIAIILLFIYICIPNIYIRYCIDIVFCFGIFILIWGLYIFFNIYSNNKQIYSIISLFYILVLTNISIHSAYITYIIISHIFTLQNKMYIF